ncbi:hypothetical protein NAS92_19295 [Pantoea brenneri]|uniref:hypothetical protein n=1 Tax=Pantoea brenneri TaxID=472694 RepID=UPI00210E428E|nr:hypothetical protein [Pantoea brenneri]MCQ5472609.1 hypothetical protein [Pantoea brenneri]
MANHAMADLNDALVQASVRIDDGSDHSQRIVWQMNQKRYMRNGLSPARPPAPQVSPVKIEPKKKPRKRGYKIVQQAIGAV